MADREPRSTQTRENHARKKGWERPTLLPKPDPREGVEFRWIATAVMGQPMTPNVSSKFREGWTPRPADTIPKDFPVPTIAQGQWEGHVGIEGMILCEMPESKVEARTRYFAQKNADLNKFVDSNLNKVEQSGGLAIDRNVQSSVSRGQKIVDD